MKTHDIISRQNAKIAHMRKLSRDGSYRRKNGQFLCEGGTLLHEALDAGLSLDILLHDETADAALLGRARKRSAQVFFVPSAILEYVSDVSTPLGFVFSLAFPTHGKPRPEGRYLVLDGVSDPGNMGSIIRSADAFSLDALYITGTSADIYAPKVVRASAGAIFRINAHFCDYAELKTRLQNLETLLYGAVLEEGALDISRILPPCAVAIGNEAKGISNALRTLCHAFVKIPMSGKAESLNAAVAAGIISYCISRA